MVLPKKDSLFQMTPKNCKQMLFRGWPQILPKAAIWYHGTISTFNLIVSAKVLLFHKTDFRFSAFTWNLVDVAPTLPKGVGEFCLHLSRPRTNPFHHAYHCCDFYLGSSISVTEVGMHRLLLSLLWYYRVTVSLQRQQFLTVTNAQSSLLGHPLTLALTVFLHLATFSFFLSFYFLRQGFSA